MRPAEFASEFGLEGVTAFESGDGLSSAVGAFAGATLEVERNPDEAQTETELRISRYEDQTEIDPPLLDELLVALRSLGIPLACSGERRYSHARGVYRHGCREHPLAE